MPHNVDSMAYYGEVPWHGLGTNIPERANSEQMIVAAGLDWSVESRPARGARKDKKERYSRYEIVRLPRPHRSEHETLLGVTSRFYVPLQNKEAFEFFDPVVGDGKACFETAGALGEGECVWVLAKMPEVMEIVRGDECLRYLLLSNRHDGKGSVSVKFTAVRVVCQNTLMLAMQDGESVFRVRHSKVMNTRLAEIGEVLGMARQMYEQCGDLFKAMAVKALSSNKLDQFLEAVYPKTDAQKKSGKRPEKWERVIELIETRPDLQMPGVRGTLWGAYNGVTRFEDYRHTRTTETTSARLNRVWFGDSADAKLRALVAARSQLAA